LDTFNAILDLVIKHWAFVASAAVFMLVGFVANKRIFTEAQAKVKRKSQWIWWWGRKTLPLHPVLAGIVLGFLWKLPEPGVDTLVERCGYFAFAGVASVFLYEVIKHIAKKRGVELELPGESKPPDPPPGT
jgi:hypothetical protein